MHYTYIASITIDSVMRIDKKNHPQVYLEKCKYRVKEIETHRFINTELKSDSGSDSELDSEVESNSHAELMAKLSSDSDSESHFAHFEQLILLLVVIKSFLFLSIFLRE